jgi:NAD(P)-dependent dehydrogenase (short-subunit alcohol dehydrogenase family)
MDIRLEGKRALVTGGDSGIGAATVLALAKAGAKVAVNYVGPARAAHTLVKAVMKVGGEAIPVRADVSDPAAVAKLFRTMDAAWGGIDVLINNAGIDGAKAMGWNSDIAAWRKVLEVNLFGSYYCAREALKRMVPRRAGVVLSTTSVHEKIAWSGHSAYTASKAAVGMLTRTLAQEAAPHGVRVLALGPGAVKTAINRAVWGDRRKMRDLLEKTPLQRIGEPDEIARMAAPSAPRTTR